jgi:molybdopterin molybdotransferase
MISYNEALSLLSTEAELDDPTTESVSIEESIGRYLAQTLYSRESSPPFDNSAMDGFAVNTKFANACFNAGQPLVVQSCVAAGDGITTTFDPELAVEIMTGAPMPGPSFDSVIKIEDVRVTRTSDGLAREIFLQTAAVCNENIRRAGEDFQVGQKIAEAGTLLNENHVLAFATLGVDTVCSFKRPHVAVASTGKELVPFETKVLLPGKIRNSTGVYLTSYLKERGIPVENLGTIGDSAQDYISTMKQAFEDGTEIFISTGAVSMGQFDFVKQALSDCGAKIIFHKCAIRPGKPILFAVLPYLGKNRYIFGIPGNPVSTAVGLRFFIMPFIEKRQRASTVDMQKATLSSDVKKPDGFRCFFKAKTAFHNDALRVTALPGQASFMVSPLLQSNSWVVLTENKNMITNGSVVEVCSL